MGSDQVTVLVASRLKSGVAVVGFSGLAGLAYALLTGRLASGHGGYSSGDWRAHLLLPLCGFFSLCAAATAATLLMPATLTLTSDGFELIAWRTRRKYRWQDIAAFRLQRSAMGTSGGSITYVAWDNLPGLIASGKNGGTLPGGWTLSTQELCALMQSRLDDYRAQNPVRA